MPAQGIYKTSCIKLSLEPTGAHTFTHIRLFHTIINIFLQKGGFL